MISELVSQSITTSLLNSLCQHSSEGIVLTDVKHIICFANTAFLDITGYSQQDITGNSIVELQSTSYEPNYFSNIYDTVQADGSWTGQLWGERKNGESYLSKVTVIKISGTTDGGYFCYLYRDVSQIQEVRAKLKHSFHHDPLTDLPNRILLMSRIEQSIIQAARKSSGFSLLVIDLDDFKKINDGFGHSIGDRLLRLAAQRITSVIKIGDSVSRSGGDEFTVLLPDICTPHAVQEIADRIIDVLVKPFTLQGATLYLGATIGISMYPDDGTTPQLLMSNADLALIRAKEHCKGTCHFFTPDLNLRAQERIYLEDTVRTGLEQDMIQVYFQPVIDMETGKLSSSEALARLFHPERGEIPPSQFIPMAEKSGLIYRLGEQVFRKACQQYSTWLNNGVVNACVGINLSARQFLQPDIVDSMLGILDDTGLAPDRVIIEITENSIIHDISESVTILKAFKNAGMQISIDDFGTGYSSLSYLKTLPVDQLKIDKSFIYDLMHKDNQAAIVTAVIAMAHSMNMRVVAEGVETKQQFDFLKKSNCDFVQGYYFSRPLSISHAQPHFEKETVYFYGS